MEWYLKFNHIERKTWKLLLKLQEEICRNGYPFCYEWENFGFYFIENLTGTDIYMDCAGKIGGTSVKDMCGKCGGTGPQYRCDITNEFYCSEYEYQQKCAPADKPDSE